MSTPIVVIVALTVTTLAIKALGPITVGGRELPGWARDIVLLLGPALLAALVVTQTFTDGQRLTVGPEAGGVALSGVVMWRTGSVVATVGTAAAVTAVLRALG
ncbi:MAG: AzlD domain-containing protein [Solirubrobacteraceae bacterium]